MTKFIDFLLEWNELQFILAKISDDFLLKFWNLRGAKVCTSCRSRKMLKNAPTLAIVAVDTAENEPLKISLVHFISSIASLPAATHRGPTARSARSGGPAAPSTRATPCSRRCCCRWLLQRLNWAPRVSETLTSPRSLEIRAYCQGETVSEKKRD